MTGIPLEYSQLYRMLETGVMMRWLSGLLIAVVLIIAMKRIQHIIVMPTILLGAVGIFFLIMEVMGIPLAEAASKGWLLGPLPGDCLWKPVDFTELTKINWGVILKQTGSLTTILVVSTVNLLFNVGGVELSTEQDVDIDRELISAGFANIVSGLGGSMIGFQGLSASVISYRMGANSRMVGFIRAAVCVIALFLGSSVLSVLPKPVLGGLIMFAGLSFLLEWIYKSYFRLPRMDYFVVIIILGVIGTVGFLEGVIVGTVAATVLFVINYSRINVVKHTLSGSNFQSNVDRSAGRPPGPH